MSYPISPKKYKQKSLVLPKILISKKENPLNNLLPPRAILCFSPKAAQALKTRNDFKKSLSFYTGDLNIDLYTTKKNNKNISVCVASHFGIGAPAAVVVLEKLRSKGVKQIISLGLVGCLNKTINRGHKVWIQKSFRDEGCSYHYQKPSAYITQDATKTCLDLTKKLNLKSVISWTTDAPFRETKSEVEYFKSQGAECVEMESSALMAAGKYYGISVLCLGVVSDFISIKSWTPQFSYPEVKKSLNELLNQVLFL